MEKESLELLLGQGLSVEKIAQADREGAVDGLVLDGKYGLGP